MPPFLADAGAAERHLARRRLFPRIRLTMLPPHRLNAPPGASRVRRQQLGRQLNCRGKVILVTEVPLIALPRVIGQTLSSQEILASTTPCLVVAGKFQGTANLVEFSGWRGQH